MKRLSVVFLSLIIALSMFPSMAFAEGEATKEAQEIWMNPDVSKLTVYMHGSKSTTAEIRLRDTSKEQIEFNVGECTVKSANKKIATVSKSSSVVGEDGFTYLVYKVKGVKAGSTKVSISFAGNETYGPESKTVKVTVKNGRKLKAANVSLSKTSYKYDGENHKPTVTVKWDGKKVNSKYYTVERPDESKAIGSYTVKVTGDGGLYYGTVKKTYKVVKGDQVVQASCDKSKLYTYKDEKATVKFESSSIGTKEASFKVSDSKMLKIVDKDSTSCTVQAIGNKSGTATVTMTVKGNDNYNDCVKKFDIKVQGAEDLSKAKINLSKSSYTYSGKANKPAVSVTLNGKKVPSDAYTVTYSNNTNAGTAKVTIKAAKDNKKYMGSKSAKYKINKAAQELKILTTPSNKVIPANRKNHDVFQLKVKSVRKGTASASDVDLTKIGIKTGDKYKALRTGKLFELDVNPTNLVSGGYAVCKFEIAEHNTGFKARTLTFTITSPATKNYTSASAKVTFKVQ
ncbi:MAG: hypothetical protein KBS56_02885 [Clostridiales bacterium]|nr:hypothetical protein [Candidatus Crickella equi]